MSDFQKEYEAAHTELLAHDFFDIEEHNGLQVGTRVRHRGEQYSKAIFVGTGNIRAVMRNTSGTWERNWGRPNIELLVELDKPRFGDSRLMRVADYHVCVALDVRVAQP